MHLLKMIRRRHSARKSGDGDVAAHGDGGLVIDTTTHTTGNGDGGGGGGGASLPSTSSQEPSSSSNESSASSSPSTAPVPEVAVQELTLDEVARCCAAYKSALSTCGTCAAKLAMVRAVKLLCSELVKRDGTQAQRLTCARDAQHDGGDANNSNKGKNNNGSNNGNSNSKSSGGSDNGGGGDEERVVVVNNNNTSSSSSGGGGNGGGGPASATATPWCAVPAMQQLLQRVSNEPAGLRARHGLALFRCCLVLEQELEDESLTVGSGFLSNFNAMSLQRNNNNTAAASAAETDGDDGSAAHGSANDKEDDKDSAANATATAAVAAIPRYAALDLVAVYRNLLADSRYLPSVRELHEILLRTTELLRAEANVVQVRLPAVVVGDIHGQVLDLLQHILPAGGPLVHLPSASAAAAHDAETRDEGDVADADAGRRSYLFLGDYVDRGPHSLQCICLLFVAKLLAPDRVFLLRGNHESQLTNRHYGFLEECHRRYPVLERRLVRAPDVARPSPGLQSNSSNSDNNDDKSNNKEKDGEEDEPVVSAEAVAQYMAELSWDMSDHPFWLLANDTFRCLPLCAVLCEERVEDAEAATAATTTTTSTSPQTERAPAGNTRGNEGNSTSSRADDHADVAPRRVHYVPRVAAMHGGLSPYIGNSLDGVLAITRERDVEDGALADLLWADPAVPAASRRSSGNGGSSSSSRSNDDMEQSSPLLTGATTADDDAGEAAATAATPAAGALARDNNNNNNNNNTGDDDEAVPVYTGKRVGFAFNARGVGHTFGEDVTFDFLRSNALRFVVRAHQCVLQGYQWQHQHRVLTVFSATNYCGTGNKGAVLLLSATAQPRLVQYSAPVTHDDDNDDNDDGDGGDGKKSDDDRRSGVAAPVPPRDFV